jgi:YegS/Rv2252/BmrU family lipid kinase
MNVALAPFTELPAPERVVAIVNPMACGGSAGGRWSGIENTLRHQFGTIAARFTERSRHATELAREALESGADLVIAFGGDGTANEVLGGFVDENGINRFPKACLGTIAAGTGGDFQRLFGKERAERQVAGFLQAKPRKIDYGVVRYVDHEGNEATRAFLNVSSVGISGEVARRVNSTGRSMGPTATYVLASLQSIVAHRNIPVQVCVDEEEAVRCDLTLACIANGQYFGSGMHVCPNASLDDGLFDFMCATGMSRSRLVAALAKVFAAKHQKSAGISFRKAKSVEIRPIWERANVAIEVDGEQPGRLPARYHVVERGLWLRVAGSRVE